jgi:hypothetical protein
MPYVAWNCALGEASPAYLICMPTVPLAPMDDSVDTNSIVIEGAGTIVSFGDCQRIVMKRVKFVPLTTAERAGGAVIVLRNSPQLNLLSGQQRSINDISYGFYQCDGANRWNEVYFVQRGTALVSTLEERINALERRVEELETKQAI